MRGGGGWTKPQLSTCPTDGNCLFHAPSIFIFDNIFCVVLVITRIRSDRSEKIAVSGITLVILLKRMILLSVIIIIIIIIYYH